jgi:hypothetical protein
MCEVNYTIQKKKTENSKYTYKMNEQGSQIFVFELVFRSKEGINTTIRRIKRGNQGNVISSSDEILYNNIERIKISILDSNNINNQIQAKIILDQSTTYTTYITNEIYLEFNNNNNYLDCNYNIP